jgi:hypothetical protein
VSKFGLVFLVLLLAAGLALVPRHAVERPVQRSAGVDANDRLTAVTGLVLYLLIGAIAVTILFIQPLLSAHYLVGLMLVPPVVLKLGSTGYRFVRYYTRNPESQPWAGQQPSPVRIALLPPRAPGCCRKSIPVHAVCTSFRARTRG